jgi:hypothetical protein
MYYYTISERERERSKVVPFFIVLLKSSSFLLTFHRRAESKSF